MMASESEEMARQLNSLLPGCLRGEDIERNPEFVSLLKALSQHIDETGTAVPVKKDLKQAQSELRSQKNKWLEQHTLYRELQEFQLDSELTETSHSQFYKVVKEILTLAEIADYLPCNPDPSSDITLLGLTKEDLNLCDKHKQHKESVQQKLIPEIELRLRKRCESLVGYYNSCTKTGIDTSDNQEPSLIQASQLPSLLEAEQLKINDNKRLSRHDRASVDRQLEIYTSTLRESLETLESIITQYKLQEQPQIDKVNCEWLALKCDAICLKVKLIQLELMNNMYYSDTVQALNLIKRELEQATSKTEEETINVQHLLQAYKAVGMGFDDLVEEYTKLKCDLDNKRWAVRMIKKHEDNEDMAD